jgi:hypothetical protein
MLYINSLLPQENTLYYFWKISTPLGGEIMEGKGERNK